MEHPDTIRELIYKDPQGWTCSILAHSWSEWRHWVKRGRPLPLEMTMEGWKTVVSMAGPIDYLIGS